MKHLLPYLFIFIAIPNWMCKKDGGCNCFKGTGTIVSEERTMGIIREISIESDINVYFQEDTIQRVTVQAGKNLIDRIETELAGGMLTIRDKNKCNFLRRLDIPINVYIHYVRNQFYEIRTVGTGLVTNTNPCTNDSIDLESEGSAPIVFQMGGNCKTFTHQHGAGDITLTGSCDQVIIYSKGTGFTITDDCANNYTWVYTNTTGKVTVHPLGLLETIIDGSGNIYYAGTPTAIHSTLYSTGRLLPL